MIEVSPSLKVNTASQTLPPPVKLSVGTEALRFSGVDVGTDAHEEFTTSAEDRLIHIESMLVEIKEAKKTVIAPEPLPPAKRSFEFAGALVVQGSLLRRRRICA